MFKNITIIAIATLLTSCEQEHATDDPKTEELAVASATEGANTLILSNRGLR
ncbi:MAG: hypothetical protein P8I94_01720 [Emcibacteraceae bacterium]|nr:hypothetical protein [Emcibacteraceae bacterium]